MVVGWGSKIIQYLMPLGSISKIFLWLNICRQFYLLFYIKYVSEKCCKIFWGAPIPFKKTKPHLDGALLNVPMCYRHLEIVIQFCKFLYVWANWCKDDKAEICMDVCIYVRSIKKCSTNQCGGL